MHIENIELENNFIGYIYLYSEKEINENTINISKLLAYALSKGESLLWTKCI